MNRREFLSWVGVGGVASYLPVALAACASTIKSSDIAASPSRTDGFVKVGTLTDLKKKGQLSQDKLIVIPSSSNPKAVFAVNPTCTHKGCTVDWEKGQKAFVCPCHGSQFASDGKVLHGPANKPLPTYATKLEGDVILVKKG